MDYGISITRRFGALALALLLGLAFCGRAAAANSIEEARRHGKLVAGVNTDFPPFGYLDASGAQTGFDAEIAGYLARAIFDGESRTEFVPVTTGARIPFLYSGFIDIIIATFTATEERRQVLELSEPYFLSGSLLLVRRDGPVKGPEDLNERTVGFIDGSVQAKDLEIMAPKAKKVKFEAPEEAVGALKSSKIDAFCLDDILVLDLARKNPDLQAAGRPFIPRPYVIAVQKGDVSSIAWINKQLARMKSDGTYDRLWKKYFGEFEANLVKP